MGSGEGSKAEGIDLSGHLGRKLESRFFKQIISIGIPPRGLLRERFQKKI